MVAEQWKVHEALRHQMTDVKDRMATMEEAFDKALAQARKKGHGVGAAITKFFNSLVAPKTISQLEVSHILWRFPPFLSSRSFTRLSLSSELKPLREERRQPKLRERNHRPFPRLERPAHLKAAALPARRGRLPPDNPVG